MAIDELNLTDEQLLHRYLAGRSDQAFEAIVQRFGPMVMGVCVRVLRNRQDAEDAFQATFLVLFRKADSVAPRELVGNWLYGVALKTANKIRGKSATRHAREKQMPEALEPATVPAESIHELQQVLDEELSRLPGKYRVPLVLCELQGKKYKDVAQQLGVTVNVVSVRLVRARQMLSERLARRGVIASAGLLIVVLSQKESAAEPPHSLVSSTVDAARLLAAGKPTVGTVSPQVLLLVKGMVNDMLLAKMKTIAATGLLAAAIGGGFAYQALRSNAGAISAAGEANPAGASEVGTANANPAENAEGKDAMQLQGIWIAVAGEANGKKSPPENEVIAKKIVLTIADDKLKLASGVNTVFEGTFKVDQDKPLKEMDWLGVVDPDGKQLRDPISGVYRLDGDTLTYCYAKVRPKALKPKADRALDERMYVFKRVKT